MIYDPNLVCPNCAQMDYVQKVSAIVSAGRASSIHTGHGIGYYGEDVSIIGRSQTVLSTLLAPPVAPPRGVFWNALLEGENSAGCQAVLWLFLIGLVAAIFIYITDLFSGGWWIALVITTLCWGLLIFVLVTLLLASFINKKNYPIAKTRWQQAVRRWQSLYYCHRCDVVFIPGQYFFVQPSQISSFLYES